MKQHKKQGKQVNAMVLDAYLPAALFLPGFLAPALALRMLSCQVGCLRMENLKLSAACPLVPLSRAKGGAQPLGGTMQATPALHYNHSSSESSFKAWSFV